MDAQKLDHKLQVYLTKREYLTIQSEAEKDHRKAGEWARIELAKILKKNTPDAPKRIFQLVEV